MDQPAYPAARLVAPAVQEHFARHLDAVIPEEHHTLAPRPSARTVEAMVDAAFWASLRREEDHVPRISLAYMPPEQSGEPLLLERRLPLGPRKLTRLAPAVERPGIHLGVWHDEEGELHVWGTTRSIPRYCFVLEVVEPGLLVVKHRRDDEFSKFANVAVLEGDQVKIVDELGASLPDCPTLVSALLGFSSPAHRDDTTNILVQLAISMRAHRRGGSLLVVRAGDPDWEGSIVPPIQYPVSPAYGELCRLVRAEHDARDRGWQDALRRAVDALAGLTAVDGATIINHHYELLAFGAKIGRPDGSMPVDRVSITEPIVGGEAVVVHPAQIGGTRHLSAAQFVHDQRDSLALVASQDGRFTIFAWSPCEGMVHAHRVESLLL